MARLGALLTRLDEARLPREIGDHLGLKFQVNQFMLARLEHKVMRLKRVALGPVELGRLATGKCRPLTTLELKLLRRAAAPRETKPGP